MGYRLTFDPEMLARPVFCEHIHYRAGTPYRAADLEVTKNIQKIERWMGVCESRYWIDQVPVPA
jgi:hypothetical protein